MILFDRREFLALGSVALLAQASAQERRSLRPSKLSPPPTPKALPQAWLDAPSIPIWPDEPPAAAGFAPRALPSDWPPVFLRNVSKPDLHVFRPMRPNGHALLVVPGGAYQFVSVANEGVDVGARMTALGMTVFVLTYRLPGEGWPHRADVPLQDAQRAMRVIRSEASRFDIDADKVSVLGFSAGGHLAATLATQHAEPTYDAVDATDRLSPRPFAAALVYPVVTMMKPWTHELSRNLLLGEMPTDAEVERRSAERHVDAATPPAFIVHAMDDPAVPVENSLRMMSAMREAKRPVEAHFLQEGGHAFGVGYPGTPSAQWVDLFSAWLGRLS
jgi:acetyl esterase/lipase